MKILTYWSNSDRRHLGLLQMADHEDAAKSIEQTGEKTDIYRAEAAKLFKVDYQAVTPYQRKVAKAMMFSDIYR